MPRMFNRKIIHALLFSLLLMVVVYQGCNTTANAPSNSSPPTPSAAAVSVGESAQSHAIEMEIVALQPIAGIIVATGKILVPEDRMANIGPVHEGRLVRLYAGQGSNVRKGQKLADLKFAQATYDRTRMLYEKSITAGKNVEAAEHDLEMAKASATSTLAGTKAALTSARRHLLILGLKASDIDALAGKSSLGAVFSLTSPISGIVIERNGTIGATVGSDANVFKIIDISRVWIDANVFEKDLERVRRGQEVKVSVPAFPGVQLYLTGPMGNHFINHRNVANPTVSSATNDCHRGRVIRPNNSVMSS